MVDIVSSLGVGSGIDTKALIDQLVAAEKTARQTPLNTRATALDARISALGQVKSSLQGIATSLATRVSDGALGLAPASSNGSAVAISRSGSGPATAFVSSLTVNRLASAQQLTAPALAAADAPVGQGTLTIAMGTRTGNADGSFSFAAGSGSFDVTIDATNNTITGLRDAINKAGGGVTATIVSNAGSATLSLRGNDGAANGFIISAAQAPGDTGLSRFAYTPGNPAMTLVTGAGDADLSLDGIAVTRSSNVIDDLIAGTQIRLLKADPAATTTLSAARDGSQLSSTLSDLASTLTAMRALIGDFRHSASGDTAAGALVNDSTARAMDQRLVALVTAPAADANGLRLSDLGLSVNRAGGVDFDASRFAALSPRRYGDAETLLKSLSAPALATQPGRLQSIAALVAPASSGLTRQRSSVTADLAKEDARLATYRDKLTRQYAAMNALVAASKAVGEQLDQQIKAWQSQRN